MEQHAPVAVPHPPPHSTHQPTIPAMCPALVEAHLAAAAAWTSLGVHHPLPAGFNPPPGTLNHPFAVAMNPAVNPFPASSGAVGGQATNGGCGAESPVNTTPELMDVNQIVVPNGAASSISSQVQIPDHPGLSTHDVMSAANDPSQAHIHHHVHQHHYHNHARNPIPPFPGYHFMVPRPEFITLPELVPHYAPVYFPLMRTRAVEDYIRLVNNRHTVPPNRGANRHIIEKNTFAHRYKRMKKTIEGDLDREEDIDKCTICLCEFEFEEHVR